MLLRRILPLFVVALLLVPHLAYAHFIWMLPQTNDEGTQVHIYFGELAEADDPSLLDNIAGAKVWQMDESGKKVDLATERGEESIIAAPMIKDAPTAVVASHNYGVLERGDSSFVLQYYAKTYHNAQAEDWNSIPSAKALKLDVTPTRLDGGKLQLLVTWDGKPLADAELTIEDDLGDVELDGKTDAEGKFVFKAPDAHVYSIRTKYVEEKSGEQDGKKYGDIRHYSTLGLRI